MIEIKTNHPVALDIPDHIFPDGIFFDNNTNPSLIQQILKLTKKDKIKILDLGCAGGQFITDFHNLGHTAVGLEGSDFAYKNDLHCWKDYYQECLFNADLRYPFEILEDGKPLKFDIIHASEFFEHLTRESLCTLFEKLSNIMHVESILIGNVPFGQNHFHLYKENGPPDENFPDAVDGKNQYYYDVSSNQVYGPKSTINVDRGISKSVWGNPRDLGNIDIDRIWEGYHNSTNSKDQWKELFSEYFEIQSYPFLGNNQSYLFDNDLINWTNSLRPYSLNFCLKKKTKNSFSFMI